HRSRSRRPRPAGGPAAVSFPHERMLKMADWKKVALAALLADGQIDDNEVKILKKELYADGKIDKDEVEFLIELRNTAQKKAKGAELNANFEKFFFKAVED